jgi:hypothetical protein
MAQLSYNTVFYDQLILKISDFLSRYNSNKFSTYQEMADEYSKLITEINNYSGSQVSYFDPYIKRRTSHIR